MGTRNIVLDPLRARKKGKRQAKNALVRRNNTPRRASLGEDSQNKGSMGQSGGGVCPEMGELKLYESLLSSSSLFNI